MRRLFVALVAIVATTVAAATPASAHVTVVYDGSDYAYTSSNHFTLYVHDVECDGIQVQAQAKADAIYTVTDGNGCAAGGNAFPLCCAIREIRIREAGGSWSPWKVA